MRGSWNWQRAVAVAIGGVLGAGLRWSVLSSVDSGRFPWPVLVVNAAGSLVLGVLLAEEWSHPSARLLLHDAGGIGFCGSLTTFSTFSVEVVDLARDGSQGIAALYAVSLCHRRRRGRGRGCRASSPAGGHDSVGGAAVITAAAFVAAVVGTLARAEAGRRWNRHNGIAVGTWSSTSPGRSCSASCRRRRRRR